ncbi:hypothetical protein MMC29_007489 [Sticta canariensis]|nr:hypothetical protein [Sticta canariensis]
MNNQVAKTRPLSCRVELSKASEEDLDTAVRESEEPSNFCRQQSADVGHLAWADGRSEFMPLSVDNALLTTTNSTQLIEDEEAEQTAKSILQPKPLPLKRPCPSLLQDFGDQPFSSPAPKRYRPESVDKFVTQWVESTSGSESYRERHCRSDSFLAHSDGDLISRSLTKSVPNIEHKKDTKGITMPPTPASAGSRPQSIRSLDAASYTGGSARSSGKNPVEQPTYRDINLAANNIYMRSRKEQFPKHITDLVDYVRSDRASPGPPADHEWEDEDLEGLEMGAPEGTVQTYFQNQIFPRPTGGLTRIEKLPMARHAVPNVSSEYKLSYPVPDLLYGYNRNRAFPQQQVQLRSMNEEVVANTQGMLYPFFFIEFTGDGPSGAGSLWVATNQCLGGSASCVHMAERLNDRIRQCKRSEVRPIDSAAFSIAMSGTEARLYISWKHDELEYYMREVRSFLLQDSDHYLEFRKYVRNIIDWGRDKRLKEIQASLDNLLEESGRRSSEAAKSRPPPSEDSPSSVGHKRQARMVGNSMNKQ